MPEIFGRRFACIAARGVLACRRGAMKRELIVTANGRDRSVTVDGPLADGRFRVVLDGAERVVDARAVRPGTWSLMIDGRSFVVDLDSRRGGVAATVGAGEAVLQVEDALHRDRQSWPRGPRIAGAGEPGQQHHDADPATHGGSIRAGRREPRPRPPGRAPGRK